MGYFNELTFASGYYPVSYTHLDVYKRQLYTYNPPRSAREWVNKEALVPREGRMRHHSDYRGMPPEWLGDSFLAEAEALRLSDETAWRHMYLGEVTGTGGQVFENLKLRPVLPEEWHGFPTYCGLDFGFAADPDAFVRCAYDRKRRRLYVVDEFASTGLLTDRLAREVRARCGPDLTTCDSAEPRSIAQLRALGLRVTAARKGPDSVEPVSYTHLMRERVCAGTGALSAGHTGAAGR